MGTPDFAVGPLRALLRFGHEIAAVVTQPDRPRGRSAKPQLSPVKEFALRQNIPVFQPEKIKKPEAVKQLQSYGADVFVVAAFGQILSQEILDIPPLGCLNIHASLLPAYRGAAPIQWVILNGEQKTGVTIMRMDAGLDTGEMLAKEEVPIAPLETDESLHDKLMEAGSRLIVETLPRLAAGELQGQKQDDAKSCYAKMLTKEMGKIDWTHSAVEIERKVRGLYSWPGAYSFYRGKQIRIFEAQALESEAPAANTPGTVCQIGKDAFLVAAGQGVLKVLSVQMEGKKRVTARDFLNGCRMERSERLG